MKEEWKDQPLPSSQKERETFYQAQVAKSQTYQRLHQQIRQLYLEYLQEQDVNRLSLIERDLTTLLDRCFQNCVWAKLRYYGKATQKDEQQAMNVCHMEAFRVMWRDRMEGNVNDQIIGWLFQIYRRRTVDYLRKEYHISGRKDTKVPKAESVLDETVMDSVNDKDSTASMEELEEWTNRIRIGRINLYRYHQTLMNLDSLPEALIATVFCRTLYRCYGSSSQGPAHQWAFLQMEGFPLGELGDQSVEKVNRFCDPKVRWGDSYENYLSCHPGHRELIYTQTFTAKKVEHWANNVFKRVITALGKQIYKETQTVKTSNMEYKEKKDRIYYYLTKEAMYESFDI